jgi:hypothetical protein
MASSRTLGRFYGSTLGESFTRYFSYSRIPWVTKRSIHEHNGKRSLGASCAYRLTRIKFVLASAFASGLSFEYNPMVFRVPTTLPVHASNTPNLIYNSSYRIRRPHPPSKHLCSKELELPHGETHHSRGLRLCTIDSLAHQHPKPVFTLTQRPTRKFDCTLF